MEAARDRIAQSKDAMDAAERRAELARLAAKDAEANTRSAKRQLEVATEDCIATKRELGALQAACPLFFDIRYHNDACVLQS